MTLAAKLLEQNPALVSLQQQACLQLSAFKNLCAKLIRKCFLACKFFVTPAEGSLSSGKLGVLKELIRKGNLMIPISSYLIWSNKN